MAVVDMWDTGPNMFASPLWIIKMVSPGFQCRWTRAESANTVIVTRRKLESAILRESQTIYHLQPPHDADL